MSEEGVLIIRGPHKGSLIRSWKEASVWEIPIPPTGQWPRSMETAVYKRRSIFFRDLRSKVVHVGVPYGFNGDAMAEFIDFVYSMAKEEA